MRKISYRAKRKDNGEWVYGVPLKEGYSQEVEMLWYEYGSLAYTERVQVIPETVGQYTGLTDKNGKEIFEGDIVKVLGKHIDVVVFYKGCFCMDRQLYNYEFTFQSSEQLEVIGNIHDNPELVEVK